MKSTITFIIRSLFNGFVMCLIVIPLWWVFVHYGAYVESVGDDALFLTYFATGFSCLFFAVGAGYEGAFRFSEWLRRSKT